MFIMGYLKKHTPGPTHNYLVLLHPKKEIPKINIRCDISLTFIHAEHEFAIRNFLNVNFLCGEKSDLV